MYGTKMQYVGHITQALEDEDLVQLGKGLAGFLDFISTDRMNLAFMTEQLAYVTDRTNFGPEQRSGASDRT